MKRKSSFLAHACFALTLTSLLAAQANNQPPTAESSANQSAPIPMDQLGAVAGKQYQGDGLSVIATPDGARLRCAFQRLEGQVTREGLWLSSTADNNSGERFRVMAMQVGRCNSSAQADEFGFDFLNPLTRPPATLSPSDAERDGGEGTPAFWPRERD